MKYREPRRAVPFFAAVAAAHTGLPAVPLFCYNPVEPAPESDIPAEPQPAHNDPGIPKPVISEPAVSEPVISEPAAEEKPVIEPEIIEPLDVEEKKDE